MRVFLLAGFAVLLLLAGAWAYTPDRPRAALEAAYAAPPSQFRQVLGLRVHLRDTGPRGGPAVLLLHGFGSSLQTWEEWAATLSGRYRVIRLDLPGFGLTGADPSGDYTDERSIAVLAALLDQLGVERAMVIGSSMGGRLAWRFAAALPARVTKLVLMAPDGFASPGSEYGKRTEVPLLMQAMRWVLPAPLLRANLAPSYADPARMTGPVFDRYADMLLAPGVRKAILARMEQHALVDPVPLLRGLAMPILLLWGAEDRMIPAAHAADWQAVLPAARLVTLPGVGHVPMEEAPAAALAPVAAFLAE